MSQFLGRQSNLATDRLVRNLANLQASASSSRTLNLVKINLKSSNTPEYVEHPFFKNPLLNKCIILKHRLRRDELDAFADGRTSVTKVILPLNVDDLKLGGRYFFIGQIGYDNILHEVFGGTFDVNSERDAELLSILASLPSLDPFLMRERLKQHGYRPARCYFEIADGDNRRMVEFVKNEISSLISISFQYSKMENDVSSRFAQKILNDAGAGELEPLRVSLGLQKAAFDEGIFCWKGFLYYKWLLFDLAPKIPNISKQLRAAKPFGQIDSDDRTFIDGQKSRLVRAIAQTCDTVRSTLKIYDDAYSELTANGKPEFFREFLLNSPALFNELGERLGAVQHIVSYWMFRFPPNRQQKISADELTELLSDFEASLSYVTPGPAEQWGGGDKSR